jgi:hypothetical protein
MSSQFSIPDQFRRQAHWCECLGSPLYSYLLSRCAEDYERGGAVHDLLQPHEKDDESSVLPLRLLGAVHRLVLQGHQVELAKFYPSVGGIVDLNGAWEAFRIATREQTQNLRQAYSKPPPDERGWSIWKFVGRIRVDC